MACEHCHAVASGAPEEYLLGIMIEGQVEGVPLCSGHLEYWQSLWKLSRH